jgi:hypothetical protein
MARSRRNTKRTTDEKKLLGSRVFLETFSRNLARRIGSALSAYPSVDASRPLNVAVCDDNDALAAWADKALERHYVHRFLKGEGAPQRFSVAIVGSAADEKTLGVAVVLDIQCYIKPVSEILYCLPYIAKTAVSADNGALLVDEADACWFCLESYTSTQPDVVAAVFSDYFCCGHPLCMDCVQYASSMKRCGICRREKPGDDSLVADIITETKASLGIVVSKNRPEHDPAVISEVDDLIAKLNLV